MPEITLRLIHNPETGRLEVVVGLRSEEDMLPSEHERDHKSILRRLLPSLDLTFPEDALHDVRREKPAQEPVPG